MVTAQPEYNMSRDHVLDYIGDHMSPVDLIEKLEPWITTEELIDRLIDVIDSYWHDAFSEELEEYYDNLID